MNRTRRHGEGEIQIKCESLHLASPRLSLPSLCVLCVLGGERFCFTDERGLFNTVIIDRYPSGCRNSPICLRTSATLVEVIDAALMP